MKKLPFLRASLLGAAIVAAGMAFSTVGQADTSQFTLADCNSNACSPQLGNNFGTVTITDIAAGVVDVDVTLNGSGVGWQNSNGLIGFAWTLNPALPVFGVGSLSQLTAQWVGGNPPTNSVPIILAMFACGGLLALARRRRRQIR